MTVKIKLVNNEIEIFETSNFKISKAKEFSPFICKVTIYENGKKIFSRKRFSILFYKYFVFKTKKVQELVKQELENISKDIEKDTEKVTD